MSSRKRLCRFIAVTTSLIIFVVYLLNNMESTEKLRTLGLGVIRMLADPGEQSSPKKKSYDILLVGYLRGGTTFTGGILGSRKNSFYLYEPLHNLSTFGYFKPGYECSLKHESCRERKQGEEKILTIVKAVFDCDSDSYNQTLRWWQIRFSGAAEKVNDKNCDKKSGSSTEACLMKYLKLCSTYGSVVSKIPRLSVSLAVKLLERLPNLKIIYLLRDPRAIMNSRKRLRWTPVPGGAISLCNKMTDDYLASQKAQIAYPGRLQIVFYEDIVTQPLETLKTIYNFAGYEFDAAEQLRLDKMTKNSARIATNWRKVINKVVLRETNKACTHVYRLFGYPQLTDPWNKNTSFPLRIKTEYEQIP
ncbi:carbohydrate sulfotransferase 6-like [Pecten maximus]|uniref:carbohydrate sulfotransferase 6-like n=1 Tax=Pecten maximus TaxID=6579 RepID=UPI0014589781|nr:carbohydrate sulfotransferase 6-like [Pecten maximus]